MSKFRELVARIPQIGLEHHRETLLENSQRNAPFMGQTLRDVRPDGGPCLVISAGPSLMREGVLAVIRRRYALGAGNSAADLPTIVCTDGAYIQALKAGITPDWVITIDPHPTRIAVLFGAKGDDDYFERTRADHGFEQSRENERLVDASPSKLAISCSAPQSVVERTQGFERYWFVPLVDDPETDGLTRAMCDATKAPALNTGGTVGTAAWAFARCVLKAQEIAVVGMDFGYPADTPLENTQEWNLTGGDPELYPRIGDWYTSPTYWWYRQNFLDLLEAADAHITNCSEGGLLDGPRVRRMRLEEWLGK